MTRKCYFSHRLSLYLLPVVTLLGFLSCTKPTINFGNNFSSDNPINVKTVDNFTVKMSTVFLDSFPTSGTNVMLVGQYKDPFFGMVTAKSYAEITYPSTLPVLTNLSVYDSLELIFRINKSFYGDTTTTQRYLVSQLTSVMNYPYIQTSFFNNDSIPTDPTILGSTDVRINPTAGFTSQRTGDTIKIRLPDSQGHLLFNLLYNQSDTVKTAATFRGFFKGLSIYPDPSVSGAMFGFQDSLLIRLHYHDPGVVYQPKVADFPFTNSSSQFNRITVDRTGTPIETISRQHPEVPSSVSGNAAYLQPATSMYVKLLFPDMSTLLHYTDFLSVVKAELTIKPVNSSFSPTFNLPPQINLAVTTDANTIGSMLNAGTGNLTIDYGNGINTAYTYDITSYIQQQIFAGLENNAKNGLILTIPSPAYNTTFNRVVIGDQSFPLEVNQISLKISYASYQ
jgi:hypothetical protein